MSVIDDVKSRLDIVDVIGGYVTLQKSGRNFRASCPFHAEKEPSFYVFPERQSWHCFGSCNTGGDVFSFVMKKENMEFADALRELAQKTGVVLTPNPTAQSQENGRLHGANEAAAHYYHQVLVDYPAASRAREYFQGRGLAANTMDDFKIGFSPADGQSMKKHLMGDGYTEQELLAAGLLVERGSDGTQDRFRGRLMFPISNPQGRVAGFGARATNDSFPKYLNSPQTAIFDKSGLLYALDRARTAIRTQDLAVIVEGYMDAIMAHQHGFTQVVATMGTALTPRHVGLLKKLTRNISLAFDADTAGETASQRAAATTAGAMEDNTGSFNIPIGAVIGKVEKIEEKHGETNGKAWTRWDATIDGKRYGIFAPQIRDSLEVGATYALTVKVKGEYSNIVDVQPTLMDEKSVHGWNGLVGHENILGGAISVLVLPQGKDPDEIIHQDTTQWQNLVSGARPMVDYLYDVVTARLDISKPQDKIQAISELYPLTESMKDPVRRAHYRQRLARILGVDERTLSDQAARLKPARRETAGPVPPSPIRARNSPLEEYCLAMLLQHPELDFQDKGLVAEYFECSENRELFLAWQRTADLDSLREDLEPLLAEHLDFLFNKALPPTDARDREKTLADAVLRLKEGALRSSLRAREELLLSAAEAGGVDAQLSQLEQQGVQLDGELKKVFKARKQRIGSKE